MLFTLAVILMALWLIGMATHIAGAFIHILILIAAIMLIAHFFGGRHKSTNV